MFGLVVKWALLLAIGIGALQFLGVAPGELWQRGKDHLARFATDAQALTNIEQRHQVSGALRQEAAKIGQTQSGASPDDQELQRELRQARQKMLEDRANALEQSMDSLLKGDMDGLKRQVRENARQAGGKD